MLTTFLPSTQVNRPNLCRFQTIQTIKVTWALLLTKNSSTWFLIIIRKIAAIRSRSSKFWKRIFNNKCKKNWKLWCRTKWRTWKCIMLMIWPKIRRYRSLTRYNRNWLRRYSIKCICKVFRARLRLIRTWALSMIKCQIQRRLRSTANKKERVLAKKAAGNKRVHHYTIKAFKWSKIRKPRSKLCENKRSLTNYRIAHSDP